MSRSVTTTLFCWLAMFGLSFGQDVFVPRELKALPAHPKDKEPASETKAAKTSAPKEIVKRAEPVTPLETKEKSSAAAKPAAVKDESAGKTAAKKEEKPKTELTTAKTEKPGPKEKSAPASEKAQIAKTDSPASKVEKAIPAKEESAGKTVAKTEPVKAEPPKEKTEKAHPTETAGKTAAKSDSAKVETATTKKEKPAAKEETKSVAKTETAKAEPAKGDKAATTKDKPASAATAKAQTEKADPALAKKDKVVPPKDEIVSHPTAKTESAKAEPAKGDRPAATKDKPASVATAKVQTEKADPALAKKEKVAPPKDEIVSHPTAKTEKAKAEPVAPKPEKLAPSKEKPAIVAAGPEPSKPEPMVAPKSLSTKVEPVSVSSLATPPSVIPATSSFDTAFTKIADGFDFPVGKPEAEGYYKARGYRVHGHMGEDWDGIRGGDTDLKDPIYSVGDGIVVFARDVHLGWGNVIIVRHAYRESGTVKYIDALYGHLNTMLVSRGQKVSRGQQIATMGTAHGQYDAHLHFEIRKNLEIGMSRSKFQKDFSNYFDPTKFIASHRRLSGGGANYRVAMNTFTHDGSYHFDTNRNFSGKKRSTSESSAALKRSLTSTR